jgi:uncharacterized protein YecT (DUF1311 family)
MAASFDCAKAGTNVERLICETPELSKLDDELAAAYKTVLADPARADEEKRAQNQWLKERNRCQDAGCVEVAYQRRIASITAAEPLAASKDAAYGFKGEFILSRNQFQNPICQRFTQNLNQFRKLDFNVCNPRLSEKFPEFSRPKWQEIPFDIALAEEVIKDGVGSRRTSEAQTKIADNIWTRWRSGLPPFLTSGQARMWRTRIDLDGDGKEEIIIRMVPGTGIPTQMETMPPWNCDYNKGALHMMDNIHQEISDAFNTRSYGNDILYFAEDKRYYRIVWNDAGPAYPQIDIGATAGVEINQLNWSGSHVEDGNECLIDWVPTGHYKPLKRRR